MGRYREFAARRRQPCAVIAHRGAWGRGAPENSLRAIRRAAEQGYEIVEIDVRQTADGALVLNHDPTLERMTGRAERPENLPRAEVTGLALRDGAGGAEASISREHVPLLIDALSVAQDSGCFLDLDVKDAAVLDATARHVSDAGAIDIVNIKIALDSDEALERALALESDTGVNIIAMAHFSRRRDPETMRRLLALRPFMIEATAEDFETLGYAAEEVGAHDSAISLFILDAPIWLDGVSDSHALADPDAVWGRAIDAGARAIMTDHPDRLQHYIRSRTRAAS